MGGIKRLHLEGQRFGKLTVLSEDGLGRYGRMWLCACDCGGTARVASAHLRKGATKSCGCWRVEFAKTLNLSHGHTQDRIPSREYNSWSGMMSRCGNTSSSHYANYGGRGIRVYERWHNFAEFLAGMGPRPPNTSLDRINNDGNYEPGNCRWATRKQQNNNKRTNIRNRPPPPPPPTPLPSSGPRGAGAWVEHIRNERARAASEPTA